jgi:hypothetical protein
MEIFDHMSGKTLDIVLKKMISFDYFGLSTFPGNG